MNVRTSTLITMLLLIGKDLVLEWFKMIWILEFFSACAITIGAFLHIWHWETHSFCTSGHRVFWTRWSSNGGTVVCTWYHMIKGAMVTTFQWYSFKCRKFWLSENVSLNTSSCGSWSFLNTILYTRLLNFKEKDGGISHQCRLPCWTILKEGHLLQEAIPRLPNRAITGYHKFAHTYLYLGDVSSKYCG